MTKRMWEFLLLVMKVIMKGQFGLNQEAFGWDANLRGASVWCGLELCLSLQVPLGLLNWSGCHASSASCIPHSSEISNGEHPVGEAWTFMEDHLQKRRVCRNHATYSAGEGTRIWWEWKLLIVSDCRTFLSWSWTLHCFSFFFSIVN